MVQKYRKEDVVVEAIQFNGILTDELGEFIKSADYNYRCLWHGEYDIEHFMIGIRDVNMIVSKGDYLIKRTSGKFFILVNQIYLKRFMRKLINIKE